MPELDFHKSSYSSNTDGGTCVEVATNVPTTVAVRDSKDTTGVVVHTTPAVWSAFSRFVRQAGRPC
nr:DUF397 domain-containing protein [Streptomyces avicenniae]